MALLQLLRSTIAAVQIYYCSCSDVRAIYVGIMRSFLERLLVDVVLVL